MIEINEKNNYLEIIDSREGANIKTAFYPKKDTTFNVFYLDEQIDVEPRIGEPIGGSIDEPIDGPIRIAEPIEPPIDGPTKIGNIEIKRFGGSFVIDKNSFINNEVIINGRANDFLGCITFLSINTAI